MRTLGLLSIVAVLALGASSAFATGQMNPTLGMDIYYLQTDGNGPTNAFLNYRILQTHINPGWVLGAASVLVDNIAADPGSTSAGWGFSQTYFNRTSPTIIDPKADPYTGFATGGTGKLAILAHVPGEQTHGAAGYEYPWAFIKVTPNAADPRNAANYSLTSKGTLGDGWNQSVYTNGLTVAPNNLGGVNSHGMSYYMYDPYFGASYYLYDANGNGKIDNNTTAGMSEAIAFGGTQANKIGWGPDQALYKAGAVGGGHQGVLRQYIKPTGTATGDQVLADLTTLSATYTYIYDGNYAGPYPYSSMALGRSHTNGVSSPIIYLATMTTAPDEDCALINSTKNSVIALQDMNGDNVIDATNDCVTLLWRSGRFGTHLSFDFYENEDASFSDMRYDAVSDSVIVTNAWGAIVVLSLDNTTGMSLVGALAIGGTQSGYLGGGNRIALDPTGIQPKEVPEPGTLLLLGTGALGALGCIRRRMMK